jgi:DNA primase small subunit
MRSLATKVQHPERRERILAGNTKALKNHETLFLDLVKGDNSIVLSAGGETDEAVTLDIKRVIRWPTGLHGKSGLQVTEFPLSRLDPDEGGRFDALSEAVPRFDDRNSTLEVTVERAVARVGDEELELELGDQVEVGANMETFLTLKGWARPIRVQQS